MYPCYLRIISSLPSHSGGGSNPTKAVTPQYFHYYIIMVMLVMIYPRLRNLMHILVLFLQLMMALICLHYRNIKCYPFDHPSSKLLNLMLRKYAMSCETSVVARPVVKTYCLPDYSGWVLS